MWLRIAIETSTATIGLWPVDHDDRRLDAGQDRRAHAGLCRDAHFHLGDAVDQV
jgi:hypothetical protein